MKINYNLPQIGGLKNNEPIDILTSFEKIKTEIFNDFYCGVIYSADNICNKIREVNSNGKSCVLCLSSGVTMESVYKELIARYKNGKISFRNCVIFLLDEFYPYICHWGRGEQRNLYAQLLNHIDIPKENIYDFSNSLEPSEISDFCKYYEAKIEQMGEIDLAVMGIGEDGEIGYNDSGASIMSKTRLVAMSQKRQKYFLNHFSNIENVPKRAFTIGISTLLKAKSINILAWSEDKSAAISKSVEGKVDTDTPASVFQLHKDCTFIISTPAAAQLTREKTPWLVGECEWDSKFMRKAVVWLCQKLNKPILKLTLQDYLNNSLSGLVEYSGDYSLLNIKLFNDLQYTITGWPGGKPNADDATRPERAFPYPKRVLIFSPHPDDDVISMGGTAIRLYDQGHILHIAYQTSGNIAVSDDFMLQAIDTAKECGLGNIYEETEQIIAQKAIEEKIEPLSLRLLKGSIRRAEAKAACRSFGMNDENIHFLNLPFYETGSIKKGELSQKDIDIVKELIREVSPHQIYAAGDLSDPHGTHRTCIESILIALEQLKGDSSISECKLWLYRGAWQEWSLDMVDMAVPLSPSEVIRKRHAIFRHASQKGIVPFPGEDSREFWQRAEDRTSSTARAYDSLGMAEYEAIEVFVEYPIL